MFINEECIKEGVTPTILAKLIERHSEESERCRRLYDYYIGKHLIQTRTKTYSNKANNKVVCNHAKHIVDTIMNYITENPAS